MPIAGRITAAPSGWVQALAEIASSIAFTNNIAAPVALESTSDAAQAIAKSLLSGERKAILLGNAAAQHPQAGELLSLAQWIGEQTGATVGYLTESGNSVGAQLVGALPLKGGLNAAQMLARPLKAYLLLDVEPVLDAADAAAAAEAIRGAGMVVALTSFKNAAVEGADVLLPIAPFTETSGTFVNAEGRVQSFHGVVKPKGDARPAWKVLRVLGNLLGLPGFSQETSEEVRVEALGDVAALASRLSNRTTATVAATARSNGVERIADVPIYAVDSLVRRATSLQLTADARIAAIGVPASLWDQLGLGEGAQVRVKQGTASATLPARRDNGLAANTVRVPAGLAETAALGPMFGAISIERA
jgi:NADH-quinone oxidoreductase subunit G